MADHRAFYWLLPALLATLQLCSGITLPSNHAQIPRDTGKLPSGVQRPPQVPTVFNDTVESIHEGVTRVGEIWTDTLDKIVENVQQAENATFENTIVPYLDSENVEKSVYYSWVVYSLGSNPDVSDAVDKAIALITDIETKVQTNETFFKLVDHVYQKHANDTQLSEADRRVLASVWSDFASSGINIEAGDKRQHFSHINARLDKINVEFSDNLHNDTANVYFTVDELRGVPANFISTLSHGTGDNAGKLQIDTGVISNLIEIMSNAVNETTRYTTYITSLNQSPENVALLQESVELRLEVANMLGFATWDEYTISSKMAKNKKAVGDFLADLVTKVTPLAKRDLHTLDDLKKGDQQLISPVGDHDRVYSWDKAFYSKIETKKVSNVDQDKVKDYFPVNVTFSAILDFYGEIYGLRYEKIERQDADALSPTGKGSDLVWHPDVLMYAVWDSPEYCEKNNITDAAFRGFLYADLFYREGVKDGSGAAETQISPGFFNEDGSQVHTSTVLYCNFERSKDENLKPSLIQYSELAEVMHELGHAHHDLVSTTKYARLHGTQGVPIDFVEFPSQFMQNYAQVPAALKRISQHWSSFSPAAAEAWKKEQTNATDTLPAKTMPDDLIAQVINSTRFLQGDFTLRQLFYALYDQEIFQVTSAEEAKNLDLTLLYNQMLRNITMVPNPSDIGKGYHYGHGETTFTHPVSDYGGAYYSYQWCQVYAEDVFYTAFKNDPFNSDVGFRYRTQVLQPGGERDPNQLLRDFLGRDPNNEGYLEYLGVGSS